MSWPKERYDKIESVEIPEESKEVGLPDSIIESAVKEKRGMIFYDEEEEIFIFQLDKTAIECVVDKGTARVESVHREKNLHRYKMDRYSRLN